MKNWIEDKIVNNSDIIPGYAFKSKDFTEEGIPIIKIGNVKSETVDITNEETQYVEKSFLSSINSKYQVTRGDILISLTGSHLTQPNSVVGRVGRFRDDSVALVNQRAAKITSKENKSDKDFLYHLLSTFTLRKEIALLAHGAANQANVSHKDIEKIKVFWPPLPIQRKIAAVLSAYDDLIENNNGRIAILEKMAEELYREWFVRLRFPGHEKAKVVKGVPEGWEVKNVASLGNVITGKTPSTSNPMYYNGDYPFIKTPDMHNSMFLNNTEETLSEAGFNSQKSQIIPKKSICVSCIGTGGVVSITTKVSQTNQQINTVVLNDSRLLEWSFFTLKSLEKLIKLFGYTGSTMTNLSKGKFKNLKILVPNKDLIYDYNKNTKAIFDEIEMLGYLNLRLSDIRNSLLSRLMSGKIYVENLKIQFPESMQKEITNA